MEAYWQKSPSGMVKTVAGGLLTTLVTSGTLFVISFFSQTLPEIRAKQDRTDDKLKVQTVNITKIDQHIHNLEEKMDKAEQRTDQLHRKMDRMYELLLQQSKK